MNAYGPVEAIIEGQIHSVEQLSHLVREAVEWLKESLPCAYKDKHLKQRVHQLLADPRFTTNLAHFGLWDELIQDCKVKALILGRGMQKCFVDKKLGTVLGSTAVPDLFGKFEVERTGLIEVVPCWAERSLRTQNCVVPGFFPRNESFSQLWNEKCYIHFVRMIAMGVDSVFQKEVNEVCKDAKGEFKKCKIKGYARMKNKCISKEDHYDESYPRPSFNIDINRNACTFEEPGDLLSFIDRMKRHPMFGGHPVRMKNMFLFDDERAEKQFFYRTVMINWLFTPGFTYGEMAEKAGGLWESYRDYQDVPGFGDKDPSESWGTWRKHIKVALLHLKSGVLKDKKVQFIVETQLLLRPFLIGRQRMHLLYKVCRAENPESLYNDFRVNCTPNTRSFDDVQSDALQKVVISHPTRKKTVFQVGSLLAESSSAPSVETETQKATSLWKSAEQGHHLAACAILQRPDFDPNQTHDETQTTPLYIAAFHGHVEVVTAILGHPKVLPNRGKVDSMASPLFVAAQNGHEEVVAALLGANGVRVNQTTTEGVSPVCEA